MPQRRGMVEINQLDVAALTHTAFRQKRKLEELYTTLKQAGDAAKRVSSPLGAKARVPSPQLTNNRVMHAVNQLAAPRADLPRAPLALQSSTQLDSLDSK